MRGKGAEKGGYAHAVRKSDALKSQKTAKPLMRMKIVIQNTPQYERYGWRGFQ